MAAEEVLVALLDAGAQIGEREGRDILCATVEIERDGILDRARKPVPGKRQRSVRRELGRGAERPGGKLHRHRWRAPALAGKDERQAAHHAVQIDVDIQRADVSLLTDGDALRRRRSNRPVAVLDLAEHHLAGAGGGGKRPEKIAVEAAHARAQKVAVERHLRLLERGGKDDVEADHIRSTLEHRGEHAADLARPGDGRRASERRALVALLVDRHHHDRGRRGVMALAERLPAQHREQVDRQAVQDSQCRRDEQRTGCERDHDDGESVASGQSPAPYGRASRQSYSSRRRRPITGVAPDLPLGSILKTTRRVPRLAS